MIRPLPEPIGRLLAAPTLVELAHKLGKTPVLSASGLWGSSVAAVVATIRRELSRPVLLICGHLDEADDLADDVELFGEPRPAVLPSLQLGGGLGQVSEEQASNRLSLVRKLAAKDPGVEVVISPVQSLMQSVPAKDELKHLVRTVSAGEMLEPEKLIVWLSEHGYNRLDQVEVPGDFAVRGGIIDVYVPGEFESSGDEVGLAVRIDFFGDQVESIKTFDLSTLGSRRPLQQVQIMDLKGRLPDLSSGTHLFSYLDPRTVVVLWAPLEIAEQAKSYIDRLPDDKGIYPLAAVLRNAGSFTRLELTQFDQGAVTLVGKESAEHLKLPIRSIQRFETEAKKAIGELAELVATHDVAVFCENDGEKQRFVELIEGEVPGLSSKLAVELGYLHRGFVFAPSAAGAEKPPPGERGVAFLGHHELFHRYEQRRRVKKVIASRPVDSFLDLQVGDYVVHVAHGIAKFTGIQTLTRDGKTEEYLTLRFAESATLNVPAARVNLVQKYVGGFQGSPQLSRLGSETWSKQKAKVSEAVMDMAADLIDIQAARAAEAGLPYPPDTEWQKEFEAEFPYTPTPDQVVGAEEIKQDMQKPRPMDRLLCGDVGYGKTELAMRAAFKAVEYGKQVAVLVPTTVLAEQHYRSFRERMANYPFRVESISRFKSPKEQKGTLKAASAGEVDVLIGTHRLLSKDVKFKDLGLVVVDEEQRFGVTHKERLKQMRKTVDVLTMSATPIPRTLHMSMLGIRDISSLTTAPQDRRSIVTEVLAYDPNRVKLAILRELQREGQVYFVHNRVHDIVAFAEGVQAMVPDARILIGHGQMGEGELEEVMMKFIRHEADVLVCTTIIESGLDIPNANTIIIDNADRFGLSELHQLRGRVGRYKHRAYCYLLLPADRPVTPVAAKRLKAIEEYSHLGAGFKIAMRDLELRGAGNILGPEQSGHIATVGYELYCQLLEEAVRQLKDQPRPTTPEATVDIGVTAFIPKSYIEADRQRLDAYRRVTRCSSVEMLAELLQDLQDAYGEPPRQMQVFFALTELKILATAYGIESIKKREPDVVLTVLNAARAQLALTGAPGRLTVVDEKTIYLRMPSTYLDPEVCLFVLKNLMRAAYDKEHAAAAPAPTNGDGVPVAAPPSAAAEKAPERPVQPSPKPKQPAAAPKPPAKSAASSPELAKLESLRELGILSEEEFAAARGRLMAKQ